MFFQLGKQTLFFWLYAHAATPLLICSVNRATNRAVYSSSHDVSSGNSSVVVDGLKSSCTGPSVFSTTFETDPWVVVDLGSTQYCNPSLPIVSSDYDYTPEKRY